MEVKSLERIQSKTTEYYKAIIALFIGSLIAFGVEYCVQPIIPVLAKTFTLQPTTASLAVSFGTGGMAASMLLIAGVANRLERRLTMVIGLLLSSVLAVLIAVSLYFHLILLMRLCQGMLLAGFPAMAVAYINEEFDPSIIGGVVGIYVSGTSVGGLVGRILLSTLTDYMSWRYALAIEAILYIVLGILFWVLLPKPKAVRQPPIPWHRLWNEGRRILSNRNLVGVYVVAMLIMGSFVCVYNFISYILLAPPYHFSQTAIGFVYLLYLLGTVSSTVMGMMSDSIGNGKVICLSVICMLVGSLVSVFMPIVIKLLGIGIFTFGFFGAHSAACSWAGRLDSADKAEITALYMLFYYIGASVFGSLGGQFLTFWSWPGVVAYLTVLGVIALGIGLWLTKHVGYDK